MGIGRPNPRSVDILEHVARTLPLSLNPVMLQFFKSQDLEEEGSGGGWFSTYSTLDSCRTTINVGMFPKSSEKCL